MRDKKNKNEWQTYLLMTVSSSNWYDEDYKTIL